MLSRTNLRKSLIAVLVVPALTGVALLGAACDEAVVNNATEAASSELGECESRPRNLRVTESLEPLEYLDDHVDDDQYWVFHDEDNSVWARVVKERSPLSETEITLMGEARRLSWRSQAYFSKAWCEKLVDCVRQHQLVGEFWVSGVSFDGEDPSTGNFMERLRESLLPVVQVNDRIRQREAEVARQVGTINCLFYANTNRGRANAERGNYEAAISDFDKALEFIPLSRSSHAQTYRFRGDAKAGLGNYEEAIVDYDKAIEFNPVYGNAEAYTNRGNAKYESGNYEGALKDYNKAIRLSPDYAPAYRNRGDLKYELGNYEEAIVDYDEAIKLDPDDTEAYDNRGKAEYALGNHE